MVRPLHRPGGGGAGALAPRREAASWYRKTKTRREPLAGAATGGVRHRQWEQGLRRWAAIRALALAGVLICAGAAPSRAERVIVLAAASTAAAVEQAIALFDAGPGGRVVGSYAGTAALARQIESGAPADIFLAANVAWMDYLEARGLVARASRRPLLRNRLVFVTSDDAMDDAMDDAIAPFAPSAALDLGALLAGGRLVIGDPDHVPVGIYARQALEALGLWPSVKGRIAPAADARAAGALVARGEAPLGIVYATDVARSTGIRPVAAIPTDLHEPIVYPVARVRGRDSPLAARFLAFLTGPAGRAAFARAGFIVD